MSDPTNIVEAWLQAAAARGMTHQDALKAMNAYFHSNTRINRVYEWRTGARKVSSERQAYMRRIAAPYVLAIFPDPADVARALNPPG